MPVVVRLTTRHPYCQNPRSNPSCRSPSYVAMNRIATVSNSSFPARTATLTQASR